MDTSVPSLGSDLGLRFEVDGLEKAGWKSHRSGLSSVKTSVERLKDDNESLLVSCMAYSVPAAALVR